MLLSLSTQTNATLPRRRCYQHQNFSQSLATKVYLARCVLSRMTPLLSLAACVRTFSTQTAFPEHGVARVHPVKAVPFSMLGIVGLVVFVDNGRIQGFRMDEQALMILFLWPERGQMRSWSPIRSPRCVGRLAFYRGSLVLLRLRARASYGAVLQKGKETWARSQFYMKPRYHRNLLFAATELLGDKARTCSVVFLLAFRGRLTPSRLHYKFHAHGGKWISNRSYQISRLGKTVEFIPSGPIVHPGQSDSLGFLQITTPPQQLQL